MTGILNQLKDQIKGEVATDEETLKKYSTDASIFEVRPKAVVFPKDSEDIKNLVNFVSENKEKYPELSLTARSGGTDMTGGPLTKSIVVEFDKYFNEIKGITSSNSCTTSPPPPLLRKERGAHSTRVELGERGGRGQGGQHNPPLDGYAIVQPGVYYRDFEKETLKQNLIFPSYPASKSICALGGIISNNSGGEKTLRYGKTNKYVKRLKVVLTDGNEYEFRPLSREELEAKRAQDDFEGSIYRKTYELIEDNYDKIANAKPNVTKNSAGYYLWDVWDREMFDLTQLIVGSQGTLGLVTEIELGLVKKAKHSRLLVIFLRDLDNLTKVVNMALPFKPESLETFDDNTLKLAIRFMPDIAKKLGGRGFISLAFSFMSESLMVLRRGMPKFVVLVEMTGDDMEDIDERLRGLHGELSKFKMQSKIMKTEKDGEKYWVIRRESFNLLRQRVRGKRTAPFVDDVVVTPKNLPEFLPKLYGILKKHGIAPTLAGHAGSGNFHIIPLMDLKQESERAKIPVVSDEVYDLVLQYKGSITAEHNDGLIRSPYLKKMYGTDMYELFEKVKNIFDSKNIFNPGKKVDSDLDYAMKHINHV